MIEIEMFDKNKQINHLITEGDKEYNVPCFMAKYKGFVKSGQLMDEINKKLDDLYNKLKNAKTTILSKERSNQQAALKMFDAFKECVLNDKKGDITVTRFVNYASSVIPNVKEIVDSLFIK